MSLPGATHRSKRQAAVAALMSAEAEPGTGMFSLAEVAELLGVPKGLVYEVYEASLKVPPALTHRRNRHGRRYSLGHTLSHRGHQPAADSSGTS